MAQVFNLIGKNKIVGSLASILVTGLPQSGNTVTAITPSGLTKTAIWTSDGFLFDNLNEYGTYHLTATDGSRTATTDCVIDLATRYIIPLLYQIILTENNINTYFDVSNGSYYFNGSNGKWTATNLGVHSTTASSTWTSKGNYNIIMDYQVISESNYDKMSLTIAGIAILSQASGSQSGTTSQIAISTGQAVSLTFTKDVSVSASGETANISNVILSA